MHRCFPGSKCYVYPCLVRAARFSFTLELRCGLREDDLGTTDLDEADLATSAGWPLGVIATGEAPAPRRCLDPSHCNPVPRQ